MNEERPNMPEGEEVRLRNAVRSLGRIEADPDFQRRLRADFVSGRILESAPRHDVRRKVLPFPLPAWGWAAAAILVVGVLSGVLGSVRRTSWTIMETRGSGEIVAQGTPLAVSNAAALEERIAAGGRVETRGDAELDLLGDESVALGVAPGTDLELLRPPARWFGRSAQIQLFAGELNVVTGPAFPGARLAVHTPEGMVELTGTAVAVYRDSTLTCICVLEGTAAIGADATHLEDVPAGKRKVLFADSRPPVVLDIEPQHASHLQSFLDRARPRLTPHQP